MTMDAETIEGRPATPAAMTADEVRAALRADLARTGLNRAEWAARKGFPANFISAVLNGHKDPSDRLCASLGIERRVEVVYVRKGRG